jgi:hypothetical protein
MASAGPESYHGAMRTHRLAAGLLAAAAVSVSVACQDVPLLPKWDADWYIPLPSEAIALGGAGGVFPGTVPPGTSANISFPPQTQQLDESVGSLLRQELSNGRIIVTLTKTLAVSGSDTLFIAPDQASLTVNTASVIVVPVAFTATDLSVTDTATVLPSGLTMLKNVADAQGTLWIQLRGQVSYNGSGNLTVTAADSIGVKLAMLATIAVSR